MATDILWIVLAFFCGALPFSVWVGKLALRTDIRRYGDHNPGATNVLRAGGPVWGALALLLDIFKGALPIALAWFAGGVSGPALVAVALAPMLGHAYSPFLGFNGGKALAVSLGVWGGLTIGEVALVIALLILIWYAVIASDGWAVMAAAFSLLAYLLISDKSTTLLAVWLGNTLLIAWKHRADLSRPPRSTLATPEEQLMSALLTILSGLALAGISAITLLNLLTFPRLKSPSRSAGPPPPKPPTPFVSLLIPARNEAAVIEPTLRRLLAQQYPAYEIILLDDHSTDNTGAVGRRLAAADSRLRVLSGQPLPPGWLGKNWACHQLAQAANGDILIFTDADVRWSPAALAALIDQLAGSGADLLTVWPTQETVTWAERLTVPLMGLVVLGYLPALLVHHTPFASLAAANGQCLAFRRAAYDKIGGHTIVKDKVLEDVLLARHLKKAGLRLQMADGSGLVNCRMYQDWPSVRDGFAKNILAGYGGRVSLLLLATLFHWLIFWWPWLALLRPGRRPLTRLGAGLLAAQGIGLRALTAAATGQRVRDALLLPLSVLLMTRIAAQAIWWQWRYGGPRWKGRLIASPSSKKAGASRG